MNSSTYYPKIKKIADTYGYDAQSRQCIEEMAELTQAINKYWRKDLKCGQLTPLQVPIGSPQELSIIEEIADVEICLAGIETEQRLEPNTHGTCNTLTSVQKDNLVLENVVAIDEQNLCIRTDTIGTLTTDGSSPKHNNRIMVKQATKQGYIECELGGVADLSYPNSNTRRGRVQDDGNTCPTLTAENQDICRIEQVGQISSDNSQYGTVLSENGLCSTLQAGTHGYANNCIQTQYRIRKLTPRECWRLMDFADEDFEKAAEVNSNTQLYKQAGNSIVKNVLVAILGQMIPDKENVYKELSE